MGVKQTGTKKFLIGFILLIATVSCQPTADISTRPASNLQQGNEVVLKAEVTVTSNSTQIETAMPEIKATLHPDVARSFDREECSDYCWHNIMLGQSEIEVLEAIRNDPDTDTTIDFDDGDFVHIERFENARTGIDWQFLNIPSQRYRSYGSLFLDNDEVTFLVIPVEPPFPFQAILDKLGEPKYLRFADGGTNLAFFILYYPKERVSFLIRATGNPIAITGQSMIESVAYYSAEEALDSYCTGGNIKWDGLGDIVKYFPPHSQDLDINSLAEECPED